jgi:hypothetical protein
MLTGAVTSTGGSPVAWWAVVESSTVVPIVEAVAASSASSSAEAASKRPRGTERVGVKKSDVYEVRSEVGMRGGGAT